MASEEFAKWAKSVNIFVENNAPRYYGALDGWNAATRRGEEHEKAAVERIASIACPWCVQGIPTIQYKGETRHLAHPPVIRAEDAEPCIAERIRALSPDPHAKVRWGLEERLVEEKEYGVHEYDHQDGEHRYNCCVCERIEDLERQLAALPKEGEKK